jgi:hypothetical protein
METLLAFIWAPLVLYGLSAGLALLVERVLRLELPNALIAPVGLALLIAIVMPLYRLGAASGVVLAITLPCVLVGLVLAGRSLPARLNPGSAGWAALAAYALYMAPVVLTGHWTWPGYNFVNDTAPNFLYTDLLARQGMDLPSVVDSTTEVIQAAPINLGYPVGAHGLLATVQPLTGASLPAVYHPIIATVAGLAAMAMAQLARRAGLGSLPAAVAGVLPLGAVLLYRYGLHGSIKEELVVALMATGAALAREALDRELSIRLAVLIALCAAALLHVFSAVGAAYALVLGVLLLAAGLAEGRGIAAIGRLAGAGVAIAVVAVAVNLSDVTSFARHAEDTFASEGGASTAYLGHLLRPLPLAQAAGAWFARDYREPVPPGDETLNIVVIAAIGLLALAGVAVELRRRRPAGLLLLVPFAVVAAVLSPQLSPYAAGKLLVVLSPAILLMAAIGGFTLLSQRVRWLQVAAGATLSVAMVGVLVSDSLGYRMATLAPPDRLDSMTDAAEHADGGGVWLVNEWEEFAKYFMRDIKVNAAFEAESPRPAEMRKPRPIFGRYYDLDALTLQYVDSFAGIIKRRSPGASRPPASFKLSYANDYYEVWRREGAPTVIEHIPLQRRHEAVAQPACERVRALGARARRGERLVAAPHPEVVLLDPLHAGRRPSGWVENVDPPGTVTPTTPGQMKFVADTSGGRYRVWLKGSFGRPTRVYLDGRKVGEAHEINTPGQWVQLGEVELRKGEHRVRLERPGAFPAPGNSWRGVLGPVALERVAPSSLTIVAPEDASRLCGREWDWIELVRS